MQAKKLIRFVQMEYEKFLIKNELDITHKQINKLDAFSLKQYHLKTNNHLTEL